MALLLLYSDPQSHLEAARQTTTMGGVTEFMLRLLEIEHKMFASTEDILASLEIQYLNQNC